MTVLKSLTLCFALLAAAPVFAQGTNVAFGAIKQDTTAPVEATADNLSVDQATGRTVFEGNVLIGQGTLRLSAQRVEVIYRASEKGIGKLIATGGVTLVSGADAAEASRADYNIDSGIIVMTGDVLLTQGQNALTAQKMSVDLNDGTARMSGRVKTILQSGSN